MTTYYMPGFMPAINKLDGTETIVRAKSWGGGETLRDAWEIGTNLIG